MLPLAAKLHDNPLQYLRPRRRPRAVAGVLSFDTSGVEAHRPRPDGSGLWSAARVPGVLGVMSCTLAAACLNVDTPYTDVDLDNRYPASSATPLVVYEAQWQAVTFSTPLLPGASSGPQPTVPASDNTAYAVLAPGWNPASTTRPSAFVVLQSRSGFAVNLGDTLRIAVDDTTFAGNCAAGSVLTQSEADFITQIVFASTFAGHRYVAATCTTVPAGADAGTE